MKSVMQHSFSEVPRVNIPRSVFNRSHGHKTTFDADYLIPILADEVLPGDTFRLNTTVLARLATPYKPIMDNIYLETFYFFVPNRLLWENWEDFLGAHVSAGAQDTDYTIPKYRTTDGWDENTIADYMGITTTIDSATHDVNAFHFRAYYKIWNDWFRDQNIQDELTVPTDAGPDLEAEYTLQKRNKRHDYFTSCLPYLQKGTAVDLPLGTTAPVYGDGYTMGMTTTGANTFGVVHDTHASGVHLSGWEDDYGNSLGTASQTGTHMPAERRVSLVESGYSGTEADLSAATASTINELRLAFQKQRMMEKDARGGTRMNEIILSHFGVYHPDRSWRSEYLGGTSQRINIHPVQQQSAQTSPATKDHLGQLAGFGVAAGRGGGFVKTFTEHGVILGLANARADITYQEGVHRMFLRSTKYDYYWPSLAHIGEQAVTNEEIYADGSESDSTVFGYQERYAEYRYFPSRVSASFRSDNSGTLHIWHLSEALGTQPTLNSAFITSGHATEIDRAIQVPSEHQFLADFWFDYVCARPMPVYSVPGKIDHL